MSLNQLLKTENKAWLDVLANDVVIDNDIQVENGVPNDSLHCYAPYKARFQPRNRLKVFSVDTFTLSIPVPLVPGDADNDLGFTRSAVQPADINLTLANPNETTLTVNNTGLYLITIKISLRRLDQCGIFARLIVNPATRKAFSSLYLPIQNNTTNSTSCTTTFVTELTAAQVLRLAVTRSPALPLYELSPLVAGISSITFIKLN